MPSTSTLGPWYFIRTSWASASRSCSRSSPVRSTSTTCSWVSGTPRSSTCSRATSRMSVPVTCAVMSPIVAYAVRAPRAVPTAGPAAAAHLPRLRAWRAPRHGCCSSAPCSCSSRSTATRSAASWSPGGSTSGPTSTRARSTPGSRRSPAPATSPGTRLAEGNRTVSVYTTTEAGRDEFQRLFARSGAHPRPRLGPRVHDGAVARARWSTAQVFLGLLKERLVAVDARAGGGGGPGRGAGRPAAAAPAAR